jgi:hypothetical protein
MFGSSSLAVKNHYVEMSGVSGCHSEELKATKNRTRVLFDAG